MRARETLVMVVVIGAGLIGLGIARELAGRGARVTVVEARESGRAASWAGAGMLAPYTEALEQPEFEAFCVESLRLYPAFARAIEEASGVDPFLRLNGIVEAALTDADVARLQRRVAALAARGVRATWLDAVTARRHEPSLCGAVLGAALVEDEGHIDNRRLGRALRAACERAGVHFVTARGNAALEADARRVRGVQTPDGFLNADAVVNAAGAWAGELPGVPPSARVEVFPVKGQMLALSLPPHLVERVVWVPGAYLVPRDDGRLLIGATVEDAGFDVRVTAAGLLRLLEPALAALPPLRDLAVVETWAGLRPGTRDGLPFVGPTALEGYYVAAGHYRNGILLTPATASAVADAVEQKPLSPAVRALSPLRAYKSAPEAERTILAS